MQIICVYILIISPCSLLSKTSFLLKIPGLFKLYMDTWILNEKIKNYLLLCPRAQSWSFFMFHVGLWSYANSFPMCDSRNHLSLKFQILRNHRPPGTATRPSNIYLKCDMPKPEFSFSAPLFLLLLSFPYSVLATIIHLVV